MSKLQLENSTLSSLETMLTIHCNNASGKVVQNDNSNEYQPAEEGVRGSTLFATLNSQNFRE